MAHSKGRIVYSTPRRQVEYSERALWQIEKRNSLVRK